MKESAGGLSKPGGEASDWLIKPKDLGGIRLVRLSAG